MVIWTCGKNCYKNQPLWWKLPHMLFSVWELSMILFWLLGEDCSIQCIVPSLSQTNLAAIGHKITNFTKNSETTMKKSRVICTLRVNFWGVPTVHSMNQTIGYWKISQDIKEHALFLQRYITIFAKSQGSHQHLWIVKFSSSAPQSSSSSIFIANRTVSLTLFEAVSAADGALGRLDVCEWVWTVGTLAIDDGLSKCLARGALPF